MLRRSLNGRRRERQTMSTSFNKTQSVGEKQTDSVQFGEDDGNNHWIYPMIIYSRRTIKCKTLRYVAVMTMRCRILVYCIRFAFAVSNTRSSVVYLAIVLAVTWYTLIAIVTQCVKWYEYSIYVVMRMIVAIDECVSFRHCSTALVALSCLVCVECNGTSSRCLWPNLLLPSRFSCWLHHVVNQPRSWMQLADQIA